MEKRIEEYSVGELARASGVSVRTLHHYDAIGLLRPAHVAANGYRLYRRDEALRLQEILLYRAAGMPLAEIGALLEGDDRLARLTAHREKLAGEIARNARMLAALDRTISELQGESPMTIEDLYWPPEPEKQAEYEAWLVETYGPGMAEAIAASKAHLAEVPDGMQARMAAIKEIEAALVAAYEGGVAPEAAETGAHRAWVAGMWGQDCSPAAYAALAEIYLAHPDFIARYERLSPGFSGWLMQAMKAQG